MKKTRKVKTQKLEKELFVFCDYASISESKKLSISGIFDQVYIKKFPSSFLRMFLVATLRGDREKIYKINLKVVGPRKKRTLLSKTQNVKFGPNGKANLILEMANLPLPEPGFYVAEIAENDQKMASTSFMAINVGGVHASD